MSMVLKHSKKIEKATGSDDLIKKLERGDMQRMVNVFGGNYARIRGIISGKHNGPVQVIECAEKLAALYQEIQLINRRKKILDHYEKIN